MPCLSDIGAQITVSAHNDSLNNSRNKTESPSSVKVPSNITKDESPHSQLSKDLSPILEQDTNDINTLVFLYDLKNKENPNQSC